MKYKKYFFVLFQFVFSLFFAIKKLKKTVQQRTNYHFMLVTESMFVTFYSLQFLLFVPLQLYDLPRFHSQDRRLPSTVSEQLAVHRYRAR